MSGFRLDVKAWAAIFGMAITLGGFIYASGGTTGSQKVDLKEARETIQKHDDRINQINSTKADKTDVDKLGDKIDKLSDKIDRFIEGELQRNSQNLRPARGRNNP